MASYSKREAKLKRLEDNILQHKAVVDYLSRKTHLSEIPLTNQVCIANEIAKSGWQRVDDGTWTNGTDTGDLIKAGVKVFQARYDYLRDQHLKRTVKTYSGK